VEVDESGEFGVGTFNEVDYEAKLLDVLPHLLLDGFYLFVVRSSMATVAIEMIHSVSFLFSTGQKDSDHKYSK
jgi:hypothetical protein